MNNKTGLRLFLAQESRLQISNMIIDYHFEDIPYNFFLDVRQLCQFQKGEGTMKTAKQLLALLLALVMVFAAVACAVEKAVAEL